jgi:RNA polymerase sigma factor (sigma-70 family)
MASASCSRQAIDDFAQRKLRAWLWRYSRRWAALDGLQHDACKDLLELNAKSVRIHNLDAFVRRVCARRASEWIRDLRYMAFLETRRITRGERAPASPEHGAYLAQLFEWVIEAANLLPPVQRQVFLMCDLLGHSTAAVAEERGREESTVKRSLYDARQSVRRRLREWFGEEYWAVAARFGFEE